MRKCIDCSLSLSLSLSLCRIQSTENYDIVTGTRYIPGGGVSSRIFMEMGAYLFIL
jgi:hypothetical protein